MLFDPKSLVPMSEVHRQVMAQLERFPRLALGQLPTPLQALPNLSADLGRSVYIKRDDLLGPAMGGNKARKLDYLMVEAQTLGADKVATFGGLQSNQARMTAAVARQLGMEPHLFFFERRPRQLRGNLLINQLLGAHMHFIPFGGGGSASMTLETTNWLVRWVARVRLGKYYFIPVGGHNRLGCLGYVRAALEIENQARGVGIENAWVVVTAGTGGTLAGILAGLTLIGSSIKPIAIDVGKLWKTFSKSIAHMAAELCLCLQVSHTFPASDVPLIEGRYVGERYGIPSAAGSAAIERLARLEGILLDPIYTGKAFAGLLDQVKRGGLGRDQSLIFWHTGGSPGLFAFPEQWSDSTGDTWLEVDLG